MGRADDGRVILAFACAAIGIWAVWQSAHQANLSSSLAPGRASSGRIAYVAQTATYTLFRLMEPTW